MLNVPRAWKSFWAHPLVLLGYVCQVEAHFGLFRDSVNLSARWVHDLRRMYHGHGNQFGANPMVHLGDVGQVEAHFGPFGDSVNLGARLVHGCDESTIGMEIALCMVLQVNVCQVEACLCPFRDSASIEPRQVHGLRRTYHRLGNHIWHTLWYSKVTWVKWKLVTVV
jgi:hypothetical protein